MRKRGRDRGLDGREGEETESTDAVQPVHDCHKRIEDDDDDILFARLHTIIVYKPKTAIRGVTGFVSEMADARRPIKETLAFLLVHVALLHQPLPAIAFVV